MAELFPAIPRFRQPTSNVLFAEAENVAIGILDVEIETGPRSFFQRLGYPGAARFQFAEQAPDAGYGDVGVQMFVLFAVCSVRGQFRRALEVDSEPVARDAGVKRLVLERERKAKPVTIPGYGPVQIVDEKLRRDPGNASGRVKGHGGHIFFLELLPRIAR